MIKVGFRAAMINSGSSQQTVESQEPRIKSFCREFYFSSRKTKKKSNFIQFTFLKVSSKSKNFKSLFLDRLKPKTDTFQVDIFWTEQNERHCLTLEWNGKHFQLRIF